MMQLLLIVLFKRQDSNTTHPLALSTANLPIQLQCYRLAAGQHKSMYHNKRKAFSVNQRKCKCIVMYCKTFCDSMQK